MKRSYPLALAAAALLSAPAWSQTKIGDNPSAINTNAILELESASKGFLLPRLALTSTALPAPLTAHVAGMTVYNTATAGAGATAVKPGVYYNDGTKWVLLGDLSSVVTLYSGDGSITSNRTVTMGTNNLYLNTTGGVAIGGNTANANAILELISNNKGLLIPRVSLSATTNFAPLTAHVPGMMVYNTVSSGTGTTAVTPGFYFNNGTRWIRIDEQGPTIYNGDGTMTGNRVVNLGGNTLQFNNGGNVGIGTSTVNTNAILELAATNKGLLLPRLALTSTTSFGPLTAHVAGMTVYNTATNLDVTPGIYYNDGTKWIRVADPSSINTFYTGDGTINTNRTVNLGSNDLHFNTTGNTVIGSTTANSDAILELVSNNKGLLFPRLALTSTTSFGPLSQHVAGMVVYNTATINDVKPGYYFNTGTSWLRIDGSNIYNTDGAITNNRNISLGGNNLYFTNVGPNIGKIGINNSNPTSIFDVNGSIAFPIRTVTSGTSTTLDSLDFALQIANTVTGAYTVNLPNATNVTDRMYTIVNQSNTAKTVSQYFDMTGTAQTTIPANSSINIQANASGQWIQTGGNNNYAAGTMYASYEVMGSSILVDQGTSKAITDTVTLTLTRPSTVVVSATGIPFAGSTVANDATTQGALRLLNNSTIVSEAYVSTYKTAGGSRIGGPTTFTKKLSLAAGTYKLVLQAASWVGDMNYNLAPSVVPITIPAGAAGTMDSDALKSRMTVEVFYQ